MILGLLNRLSSKVFPKEVFIDDKGPNQIEGNSEIVWCVIAKGVHKVASKSNTDRPKQIIGKGNHSAHVSSGVFCCNLHSYISKEWAGHIHQGRSEEK